MQCANCGAENAQNSQFCERCGAPLLQTQPPPYQQAPGAVPPYQIPYGQTRDTNGMLIWSIVNIFFFPYILGIIALVFTLEAKSTHTPQEFEQKMKTAKTLNLVASIIAGAAIILCVFAVLFFLFMIGGSVIPDYGFYY